MEDALISPMGMAVLSGAGLIEAANDNIVYVHKTADVAFEQKDDDNQYYVEIQGTAAMQPVLPEAGKREIYVMIKDAYGELTGDTYRYDNVGDQSGYVEVTAAAGEGEEDPGEYSIKIVLPTTVTKPCNALVDYYVMCNSGVSTIEITPDNFGGYFYVEGSCLFRQEKDGKDFPAEITIPKVKVQSNFTFNMASSGDPSTFTFTCDAFPAYVAWGNQQKKILADVQIVDDTLDIDGQGIQAWIDADKPFVGE